MCLKPLLPVNAAKIGYTHGHFWCEDASQLVLHSEKHDHKVKPKETSELDENYDLRRSESTFDIFTWYIVVNRDYSELNNLNDFIQNMIVPQHFR